MSWKTVVFPILLFLLYVHAQEADPCANAPNEGAKIMCRQIHKWDDGARQAASKKKIALPPGMAGALGKGVAADFAPIASSIYQCMDLACMCTYLRGTLSGATCTLPNGQPLRKARRKEYRQMTDDERQRYHNAIKTLKQNGEYDRIGRIHSQMSASGGAHSGPAFLPWHREFIKRVEFAIRQVDPTLFLPYWDSTLESNLQTPANSALFSNEFMGGSDANGLVNSGPFTPWRTLEGRANIQRKVGAQANPLTQADIDFVMRQTEIDQVLAFTAPRQGCPYRTDFNCLEYTHGNVHIFVGGDMFDTSTSANDPLFFLHHCFIDLIWEQWRLAKQSRADREIAYPPDNQLCSSPNHFAAAGLTPFSPMRNVDGLSNKFTDNLYEYAPRPTCTAANPNGCGSQYLFCDLSHGNARCAAKLRIGTPCTGYSRGENPCQFGICQGGVCVAGGNQVPTPPKPVATPPPVTIQPQETCFNENKCCATWASRGECRNNAGYMNEWCKASCGQCKPQYRLVDDCTDRHPNCATWSKTGECSKNEMWMSENCRKSCNKCARTRAQECGTNQQTVTTTVSPTAACENSDGCYNENVCCPHWGLLGQCRTAAPWMACNCRVSCGHCTPTDYNYGSCTDYHASCAGWARIGECQKNPWMAENCRASCKTCFSQWELRDMCKGAAGSVKPVAPQTSNRQFNVGGWGPQRQPMNQWNNNNFGGNGGWGGNGGFGGWGGGFGGFDGGWGGGRWGRSAPPGTNSTQTKND